MNKKGISTPAVILIIVIIAFIALFMIAAFYLKSNEDSSESGAGTQDSTELTENQEKCIELGCPEGSIYIGSVNSDKYYECTCYYAEQINPQNRICFMTEQEAEDDERVRSEC